MDRGLFFLNNDEINKAAEQLLVCLASATDARGLRVSFAMQTTPEQARVGVAVALTALTGCNFMPDNSVLVASVPHGGWVTWPPTRAAYKEPESYESDSSGAGPRHL